MEYQNDESNKKRENRKNYKLNKTNVDLARRKINKEIYEHDKQSSISIKLDDLSITINEKIGRRGIQRGMVNKAITPGEITELIRRQKEIDSEVDRWIASI